MIDPEDGIKELMWDLPEDWEGFYRFAAEHAHNVNSSVVVFLRHFLTLSAAVPMPLQLRQQVEAFLAAEGGDRDAMIPL